MRALLALLLAAAAVAAGACGTTTEVREPDLVISSSDAAQSEEPEEGAEDRDSPGVRIAVVTHGQASSAFWFVVRNGIDAAVRETGVTVDYDSPDSYSVERVRGLINNAVDRRPDALVVTIPSEELGGAIRRAVNAGIPVVSINSGSDVFRRFGALAHVGQPEGRAGAAAGRRMARAGVRRALCVVHEPGNVGLEERCASFAAEIRRAGGSARRVPINLQDGQAQRRLAEAMAAERADGILTLNAGAAQETLSLTRVRPDVRLATFDLSPEVLAAVRRGRIVFAVDQQPYLQGYLPIVLLAQLVRHGMFPEEGDVVSTGPHFVTRRTAAQALSLTRRGIR